MENRQGPKHGNRWDYDIENLIMDYVKKREKVYDGMIRRHKDGESPIGRVPAEYVVDKVNVGHTISSLSTHLGKDRKTIRKRVNELVKEGKLIRGSKRPIRMGRGIKVLYHLAPKRIYKIKPPHPEATIRESLVPI